jgi:hypothetical protein
MWPEVSEALGQGIENWGVPASSPEIWEVSQRVAANTNLTLIGVSVYDLNEYHVADGRARIVPILQTIQDLRDSNADWELSRRLLNQYPLAYVRLLFPTAGLTDKVHVGLRAKVREFVGLRAAAEDREDALILPSDPVLQFGDSSKKVSDWDPARMLRRLALLRLENGGDHVFNGPKQLAFKRMLLQAQTRGPIILVVLPVTDSYTDEFLTSEVTARFEAVLADAQRQATETTIIRLDQVRGLSSDEYFSDLVHLNAAGRRIATDAFLSRLNAKTLRAHALPEGGE